jgi:hypothetical protein
MNLVGWLSTADQLASVASLVVATVALVVGLRQRRPLTTAQRLDRLAEAVAAQWRDEVEIQGIATPWTAVELPANRRLVVTGPAGSGKTVAAIRLVRELLAGRAPGDPVAVLFSLHSWDPAVHPHRWMAAELARTYRMPFEPALALVRARHIVPVLDGMDENADARSALRALNRIHDASGSDPLILTSREPVTLAGATVTRLAPVKHPRWETLTSPLLLSLALSSGTTPAELAGLTSAEIEERLFARFVPAVYADVPRPDGRRSRWQADRADRWLRFLAQRFDLSWWELTHAAPRAAVILLTALVTGPSAWLAMWLLTGNVWLASEATAIVGAVPTFVVIFHQYPEPSRLRAGSRLNGFIVLAGFAFGFLLGVTTSLTAAFTIGAVSALVWGLLGRIDLETPRRAATPLSVLRADRTVTLLWFLLPPVVYATLYLFRGAPLGSGHEFEAYWPLFGLFGVTTTAWSRFCLARVWLALRGNVPLRLMAFLDDAHRRGVLRRVGPSYEFRHARLRAQLARPDYGPGARPGSPSDTTVVK